MSTIRWPLTEPCYVIEYQLDNLHGGSVRIHLHIWRAMVVLQRLFLKTEVVVVQADRRPASRSDHRTGEKYSSNKTVDRPEEAYTHQLLELPVSLK